MMNLLALGLLLSATGVWSPHPDTNPDHQDSVRYEGHRLIVVEYERQLPRDPSYHSVQESKDKLLQEAASLLPNAGDRVTAFPSSNNGLEKGKEVLSAKAYRIKDGAMEALTKGKNDISDKTSQVKEVAVDAAGKIMEELSDKASQIKEGAMDAAGKVKDKISEKASQLHNGTKDAVKTGEGLAGNISSAAETAVHLTEAAAVDLGRNLTDIFRRAREVASDAAAYVAARETARAVAAVAHLLAVAAAYGACVWVTFVSSHVLARALPRQQFGMVQSKLYPVYFRVVAFGVGVALLGQYYGRGWRTAAERARVYNLTAALGLVLVNMLYVEPKATKVMFERMRMEKEEGRGRDMADVDFETAAIGVARMQVDQDAAKNREVKLNKRLKRLNTISSFLNILTLMGLTWHLVHLAHQLQPSC